MRGKEILFLVNFLFFSNADGFLFSEGNALGNGEKDFAFTIEIQTTQITVPIYIPFVGDF